MRIFQGTIDSGRPIRKVGGRVGMEMRTHVLATVGLGVWIVVREVVVAVKSILGNAIRQHCALETVVTQLGAPHKP